MKSTPTLLIVDDEKPTREGLRRALQDHFEIYVAADVSGAMGLLESEAIDLVLTDLRLGNEDGLKLLEKCQALARPPLCLMMTAYGSVETAIEAMKRGAYDYVTKPVNIDKLQMLLLRALRTREVEKENKELRQQLDEKYGLENIIGRSPQMLEIFAKIRQIADSRVTALIEGESGTGKELVAKAIHALSPRRPKPFIAVHCAALSPQVLESELFGHEKGAFTGAYERRIGRFEQAQGGTLFLDEIGEIDASTQVKLLRVLGERRFERVGGNQSIDVDVRLIAATHRNLEQMVKEGKFREDLFYRIHVVRLVLPPLRQRKEDIALLVQAFLKQAAAEHGKPQLQLSPAAEQALLHYDWPGNVRELKTALEHGVVLARGKVIQVGDLPQAISGAASSSAALTEELSTLNLEQVEKKLIQKALRQAGENRTEAAKLLGISRRTLHRKLREYSLS